VRTRSRHNGTPDGSEAMSLRAVPKAEPLDYEYDAGFAESVNVAYSSARQRVADGGPTPTPKPADRHDGNSGLLTARSYALWITWRLPLAANFRIMP
jgi:hypothetical protein